jgi:hypothetical protein
MSGAWGLANDWLVHRLKRAGGIRGSHDCPRFAYKLKYSITNDNNKNLENVFPSPQCALRNSKEYVSKWGISH